MPGGNTAGTVFGVNGTGDDDRGEGVVGVVDLLLVLLSGGGELSSSLRFSLGTRGADAGAFPPY